MDVTISVAIALWVLICCFVVTVFGVLVLIDYIDRLAEKALKAITNKYELWGIMREASALYRAKKKAKKGAIK